jgi:hypothetical protein
MNLDDSVPTTETGDSPPTASVTVPTTAPEVAETTNNQLQEEDPLSEIDPRDSPSADQAEQAASSAPESTHVQASFVENLVKESMLTWAGIMVESQAEAHAASEQRTANLMAKLEAEMQKRIDKQAETLQAMLAASEKHAVERELLAEVKREAERVAAIEHALQTKQQAEESRAKEQESAEWQQRLRKERQAESNARACIEGDFEADATTASADDVTKSFQDAPVELQQVSASNHITDSTVVVGSGLSTAGNFSDPILVENPTTTRNNAAEQDESKTALTKNSAKTEPLIVSSESALFVIAQSLPEVSNNIGVHQCYVVVKFAFPISFLAQASADTRKWADAVQSCLTAPAILVDHPNAKVFTVVSSSTVWDPGGTSPCCAATKDETTNRANDRQEKDTRDWRSATSSVWLFLPRQQACERLEEEGRGTTYSK